MAIIIKDDRWYWPDGVAGDNSWNHQHTSANLFELIKPHLKGNSTVIQAGGNCGYVLSQFVPHFRHIYTFEPDPVNFICLTMNVTEPHVIKMQACLGDTVKMVSISSEIPDIGAFHVDATPGYIPTFKVDDFKLDQCDLIQLDVEGFEYMALKGAEETIRKFRPVICAEWYDQWAYRFGVTRSQWDYFFKGFGYTLVHTEGNDEIYART